MNIAKYVALFEASTPIWHKQGLYFAASALSVAKLEQLFVFAKKNQLSIKCFTTQSRMQYLQNKPFTSSARAGYNPVSFIAKDFGVIQDVCFAEEISVVQKIAFEDIDDKTEFGVAEFFLHLCVLANNLPCVIILGEITLESAETNFDAVKLTPDNILAMDLFGVHAINLVSRSKLILQYCENCEICIFENEYGLDKIYAIFVGNAAKDSAPIVRVHSSCYTGDLLKSITCDCHSQLHIALKEFSEHANKVSDIDANGAFSGGILLYIMQEGRGIGLTNKIRTYNLQHEFGMNTVESNLSLGFPDDLRSFEMAAKVLEFFNIKQIHLLTNNPKKAKDLEGQGIEVVSTIKARQDLTKQNLDYLKTKSELMNHKL